MSKYTRITNRDTKPQGKASVISQADLDRMFGEAGLGLSRHKGKKVQEGLKSYAWIEL